MHRKPCRSRTAYGEKGPCRGVSARSGWRVNEQSVGMKVHRAVRGRTPPGAAPTHNHREGETNAHPTAQGSHTHAPPEQPDRNAKK